jgi:ABC-2 type transport system ATP-binding protein
MPTLEVNLLSKSYGPIRAVDGVSFSIEPGEIFGYLGPNGSGKTTTIRCIMGLLRPSAGQVRVFGQPIVSGRGTGHADIGYLPGEFRIWPGLKAGYSLATLSGLAGKDTAKAHRRELARRLELNLDRPVGTLSKGNRQKVGILYAFEHRPRLLVLDEPTSGLDPLVRQVVLDLIREAAADGAAVLLSSHDLAEVSAVCGRAGIIREGKLVEVAPISQIVQHGSRRLVIWFRDPAFVPEKPGDNLGIRLIEQKPGMIQIAYQGQCDPVLRWVAQWPVDRIATPDTSLEEAFMQYFRHPAIPAGTKGQL